jgi:sulfatase modifying factor 1
MRVTWVAVLVLPACAAAASSAINAPVTPGVTHDAPPSPSASDAAPVGKLSCQAGMTAVRAKAGGPAAFCIDVTEVPVRDYDACIAAGACTARDGNCGQDTPHGEASWPVNCVMTTQAIAFCQWKGKRLPTEEEWVHAACGDDGRTYPWGNERPSKQLCWMGGEMDGYGPGTTDRTPCPVGSFPAGASPFGMLDAAGNMAELTQCTGGDCEEKYVVHGGDFSGSPAFLACKRRGGGGGPSIGFRCAR